MSSNKTPRKRPKQFNEQNLTTFPACGVTTKAGGVCAAPGNVQGDDGTFTCVQHSPKYTKAVKAGWSARGADATNLKIRVRREKDLAKQLPPDLSDPKQVEVFIAETISKLQQGKLPPSVGRVINDLISTRLKVVEFKLAERLDELERQLEEGK